MSDSVSVKEFRADLARVLRRVQRGARVTIVYRSRPVCQLVPLGTSDVPVASLASDPLYRAPAAGRSSDGRDAADHDEVLYTARRR